MKQQIIVTLGREHGSGGHYVRHSAGLRDGYHPDRHAEVQAGRQY